MVNEIVPVICISGLSLLVCRIARNFYVLILYLATLLYSMISSTNLFMSSLTILISFVHVCEVSKFFPFNYWVMCQFITEN